MKEAFKTSIGGQALIEGVMMRGPERSAMAVRMPDGTISAEEWPTKKPNAWYKKTPFVRGIFNMADTMMFGYKCLMKSAEKAGLDDEEPSKFEIWLSEKMGKNVSSVISGFALVLGVIMAVGLFMVLPSVVVRLFKPLIPEDMTVLKTLLEGTFKIIIFLLYLTAVSKMKEIRRVFEYHGAEHKTIACYEAGLELTVENVKPMRRFHPRCGTSFLLIVLVISILVFSVVTWNNIIIRIVLKLAMLPLVVGVAYEIIKLAGRYDNFLTRIISAPGLWTQRLTAFEPDSEQIEVAIESIKPCIPKEKGADEW